MSRLPSFGTCPNKTAARRASIIKPWRKLSKLHAVPADRHYVSLCGPLYNKDTGEIEPFCEPLHLVAEELITMPQFHGIERNRVTYGKNVAAIEQLAEDERPFLHEPGDLIDVLDGALGDKSIHPAIVNVDLMDGPRRALTPLARTLSILNYFNGPMLVIWNVIAARTYPSRSDYRKDFERRDDHGPLCSAIERGGWVWHGQLEYKGTGKRSRTTMRSYILWRAA